MSFVSDAIRTIRERADKLAGWEEKEKLAFVPLAAHLFAIGSQLLLNEGSARLMDRLSPQDLGSLEELRARLAGIQAGADPSALYQKIIEALVTIQSELLRDPSFAAALPPFTDLQPLLPFADFRGISGRVHHWIRPLSALEKIRYDRIERIDEGKAHPPDPSPHPGIYLERLALYWDSDPQLPAVSRVLPSPSIELFFLDWWGQEAPPKPFRIALCPLEGPFHPRFCIDSGFFHAERKTPIHGASDLALRLESILDTAIDANVNLILFPELTIDRTARDHLRQALRERCGDPSSLCGVVAGSFHMWDSETPVNQEPPPFNETVLLDYTGTPVTTHRKKGRFRVPSSELLDELFPNKPKEKLRPEIFENIRYGSELKILDTPLGRLALLICADAIAADDRGYLPVIRRLRPDLLLVVSMTPETEPFDAFAEEMSRYWVGTVFVNAHCLLQKAAAAREKAARAKREKWSARVFAWLKSGRAPKARMSRGPNLAASDLALYQNDGCPPTRVRWQFGAAEPECFYFFKLAGKKKVWSTLSKAPSPHGISLLKRDGRTLGLVLDLGEQWKDWTPKRK